MNRLLVVCCCMLLLARLGAGCAQEPSKTGAAASVSLACNAVDPAHPQKRWICHCEGGSCNFQSVARQGCEHGHSHHAADVDAPGGAADCVCAGSCTPNNRIIFLNRTGGHYTPNSVDDSLTNRSSLLAGQARDVPAFLEGDAAWQVFVGCVKGLFASFDVAVTDVDPGTAASHVEAVVGGSPRNIGASPFILGLARTGCAEQQNAVVFAFSAEHHGDMTALCYTAANMIARTYGLESRFLAADIMSDLASATKSFQNQSAPCGSDMAQDCVCGDSTTQNSYARLLSTLSPTPACPCAAN